jgi:hypothetical protein
MKPIYVKTRPSPYGVQTYRLGRRLFEQVDPKTYRVLPHGRYALRYDFNIAPAEYEKRARVFPTYREFTRGRQVRLRYAYERRSDGLLRIGCNYFDKKTAAVIEKWAQGS